MWRSLLILSCALAEIAGCATARNRLDRTVTFSEKVAGGFAGVGAAFSEAIFWGFVSLPFNMLDHAVDKEIDPNHDCDEEPHDIYLGDDD